MSRSNGAKRGQAMTVLSIHHVQLAMPEGGEDRARAFYGDLLGLPEVPKPEVLQARGGVWFEAGTLRLHLGVEDDFHPAQKAHPALAVTSLRALANRLEEAGATVTWDDAIPEFDRFYAPDPFGNRLEFLEPRAWRFPAPPPPATPG